LAAAPRTGPLSDGKTACARKLISQAVSNRSGGPAFARQILLFTQIRNHELLAPSAPTWRGVSRSSRTLGAGCDGRVCGERRAPRADGQAVWSWRPDAGVKLFGDDPGSDGGYQARHPGESTEQPLTPSRRECRWQAQAVVATPVFFTR